MRALIGVGILAALLAVPASAAPPTDLIVFTRTVGNRQELFSIRLDGSSLQRLTPTGANEGAPVLSPDGRLIAALGDGGIVLRARDGRLVRRIHVRATSDLSWSPGGRWIAYLSERCESDGGRDLGPLCADLWLVRPDGRVRRRLVVADVYTADYIAQYSWAPDGRSIVFERFSHAALAIVDVRTGRTSVLRGTARVGTNPDWSRSGWISFARQRGPFKGSDLYAVRPTGRGLHKLCRAQSAGQPVSSRDGTRIAFLDYRPTSGSNVWQVRIAPTNGGRCRQVGAATEDLTLEWSPDGTRLLWENFDERLVVGRVDGRARPRTLTRGTLADWG
jgi:Tol biopolymer transport system component